MKIFACCCKNMNRLTGKGLVKAAGIVALSHGPKKTCQRFAMQVFFCACRQITGGFFRFINTNISCCRSCYSKLFCWFKLG